MSEAPTHPFRLGLVAGVTVDRWQRTWAARVPGRPLAIAPVVVGEAVAAVRDGRLDAVVTRMPVERELPDGRRLALVPLWTEETVAIAPRDHVVAAADEVTVADLHALGDDRVVPADDTLGETVPPLPRSPAAPADTASAADLVAAGAGVLLAPLSLARLLQRGDLVHRPVTDAPTSRVALVWVARTDDADEQELVGIAKGRTADSSRGAADHGRPAAGGSRDTTDDPRPARPARPTTPARTAARPARRPRPRPGAR